MQSPNQITNHSMLSGKLKVNVSLIYTSHAFPDYYSFLQSSQHVEWQVEREGEPRCIFTSHAFYDKYEFSFNHHSMLSGKLKVKVSLTESLLAQQQEKEVATAAAAAAAPAAAAAAAAGGSSASSSLVQEVFRIKGVLAVAGSADDVDDTDTDTGNSNGDGGGGGGDGGAADVSAGNRHRRYYLQGVQQLYDISAGPFWKRGNGGDGSGGGDEVKYSKIVVIGRHLDEKALLAGFHAACVAAEQ
jgi:G3E family GTPase